jgi:hypothetical protein
MEISVDQSYSDRRLIGHFKKPVVVYTHADGWYTSDPVAYLLFLDTLRTGLRELLEGMLLAANQENDRITSFLQSYSSALSVLELDSLRLLLLSINEAENKAQAEEFKSQLFYQLFFVIESVNKEFSQKKNAQTSASQFDYLVRSDR